MTEKNEEWEFFKDSEKDVSNVTLTGLRTRISLILELVLVRFVIIVTTSESTFLAYAYMHKFFLTLSYFFSTLFILVIVFLSLG